jgi:hypothetical protein
MAGRKVRKQAKESAMPNQEPSRDGVPSKDRSNERPLAGEARRTPQGCGTPSSQDDRGDGPGRIGMHSDEQPDLVAPSGVNERDRGAADDKPMGGGVLNFDDGTDMVRPRGKVTGAGRTWNEKNPSDAGELGSPGAGLSDRNGPSDPGARRNR